MALTVPRAPAPRGGGLPPRGACAATCTGMPRTSSLLRAPAPDLPPLLAYALCLGPGVFAGCRVPRLGGGPARCYRLHLCGGAWPRPPPRFGGAPARFFPKHFGRTFHARGAARGDSRPAGNFHDDPIAGLQSFRHVQAPPLARPPGCSYRRSSPSSGQPDR